jgi:hypothetical protein
VFLLEIGDLEAISVLFTLQIMITLLYADQGLALAKGE